MKKIIFISLILLTSLSGFSQTLMTGSNDTVVNTATKKNTLKVNEVGNYVTVQFIITKISGTVAGTVTLKGSMDGSNYSTLDTLSTMTNKNTFTATNVSSQNSFFSIQGNPYAYYQVSYTGSGTMSASIKSYILLR